MDEIALFDIEAPAPFVVDERVVAHCVWGDEPGKVIDLVNSGWVTVRLDRNLTLSMSTTRLSHEENVR